MIVQLDPVIDGDVAAEAARRRTFAIISHPDAGKTTLTEKLLLYAGAVELAGAVRGRANSRHATSDWLAIERERGITVTSTALQFDHLGRRFNLLDTPGHQDFSEDTYRTLLAADGAVMVLDAARGIQRQTLKLFEVCRRQRLPIVTFVNKLDQPAREPLELLDEIERELGLATAPLTWPVGDGLDFQGVYDLRARELLRFTRTERGQRKAPVVRAALDDSALAAALGEAAWARLRDEVALIEGVGSSFDPGRFRAGDQTPVFFGSALTNFGVGAFLDALADLLPPPAARTSDRGPVAPEAAGFSGFVFKIQANMDPRHRDRMAFLRVCSGRFRKDMEAFHPRLGRTVRLARPHRLFAQERETVEEAFPGDVVGLVNPGLFAIGDTVCEGDTLRFDPVPRFPPECFGRLANLSTSRHKQFHAGLAQLEEEGAVQVLFSLDGAREPILAAVGELQLDVVVARLRSEYGVEATVGRLPFVAALAVEGAGERGAEVVWPTRDVLRTEDRDGRLIGLFASDWTRRYAEELNPGVTFVTLG
ncbi:MAG: peptide chain release factor 3 [Chloroflexota bacterium]|nr:peptide chain release factor 3 [Chloroflexota bacterium]